MTFEDLPEPIGTWCILKIIIMSKNICILN